MCLGTLQPSNHDDRLISSVGESLGVQGYAIPAISECKAGNNGRDHRHAIWECMCAASGSVALSVLRQIGKALIFG